LSKLARTMQSSDPNDPNYRRLTYVRYADDFLLGFTGPRTEAEDIKRQVGDFLRETLKLDLSDSKTLLTHASTETARFLSYDISINRDNERRNQDGNRHLSGRIGLHIPKDVIKAETQPYTKHGKPTHRAEYLNDDVFSIIERYQAEYRGVVNYYRLALNLRNLSYLRWVMETSLTKTLANKLKVSVGQVYDRFRRTLNTPQGPQRVIQMEVTRAGKKPLIATWGESALSETSKRPLMTTPTK